MQGSKKVDRSKQKGKTPKSQWGCHSRAAARAEEKARTLALKAARAGKVVSWDREAQDYVWDGKGADC